MLMIRAEAECKRKNRLTFLRYRSGRNVVYCLWWTVYSVLLMICCEIMAFIYLLFLFLFFLFVSSMKRQEELFNYIISVCTTLLCDFVPVPAAPLGLNIGSRRDIADIYFSWMPSSQCKISNNIMFLLMNLLCYGHVPESLQWCFIYEHLWT